MFYLLEERFTVWLVNARDVKNVPGRKTDLLTDTTGPIFRAVRAAFRCAG